MIARTLSFRLCCWREILLGVTIYVLMLTVDFPVANATGPPSHRPRLQSLSAGGRDVFSENSGAVLLPGVSVNETGSLIGTYAQVPDGNHLGLSSQEYPDRSRSSTWAFDDFEVFESPWIIGRVTVWGIEEGDPTFNEGVFLRIQDQPSFTDPGRVYVDAVGRQEGEDLVFILEDPVILESGHYWITAWVRRPFSSGGQWYWSSSDLWLGAEAGWLNPDQRMGRRWGNNLVLRSEVLDSPPVDLGFLLGDGTIGDPARRS